jgi:hypothetical protein
METEVILTVEVLRRLLKHWLRLLRRGELAELEHELELRYVGLGLGLPLRALAEDEDSPEPEMTPGHTRANESLRFLAQWVARELDREGLRRTQDAHDRPSDPVALTHHIAAVFRIDFQRARWLCKLAGAEP